ncbi:unnamed protein product [Periconia digitata]|uniref:Uncharacterized protein n=1 Tax=Periconia digitata TaxID=1303443 RepID=A0A9W4XKK8_9PLEO|nr:unnamed protein product [Periconia digitata]
MVSINCRASPRHHHNLFHPYSHPRPAVPPSFSTPRERGRRRRRQRPQGPGGWMDGWMDGWSFHPPHPVARLARFTASWFTVIIVLPFRVAPS